MTAFNFHAITWFPGSAWEPNVLQALPADYVCSILAIQCKCREGAAKDTSNAELVNKKTVLHFHYNTKPPGFMAEFVDDCI